jgi:hypothetical protein
MGFFNRKKYEHVNGYRVLRDKDRPWICIEQPDWVDRLFDPGRWPRMFIDTKHPLWIQHMKDLANSPGAKFVREEIKKNNRDIRRKDYK